MDRREYYLNGVAPIFGASSLWAFGYFLRKEVLNNVSPVLLSLFTAIIVSVGLFFVYRLSPRRLFLAFMRFPLLYFCLSFFGVSVGTSLIFLALDSLDLGITTLLEKTQPIFTLILAAFFLKERFPIYKIPLTVLAVVSSYFIVARHPFDLVFSRSDVVGVLSVTFASASWAAATVIGKLLSSRAERPEVITFFRFFLGAFFLFPFFFARNILGLSFSPNLYDVSAIGVSAVFSSLFGYVLFYRGLKYVDATTSGFLELITPLISVALGAIFLNESLNSTQLLAVPLLLYSMYRIGLR